MLHEEPSALTMIPTQSFETLETRLFRDAQAVNVSMSAGSSRSQGRFQSVFDDCGQWG